MTLIEAGTVESIPRRGARMLRVGAQSIALFRTTDDRIYALEDRCPHRGGPLSQGMVHGHCVTCPLHDWIIDLESGEATGADEGAAARFDVEIVDGRIYVALTDRRVGRAWPASAEGESTSAERTTADHMGERRTLTKRATEARG